MSRFAPYLAALAGLAIVAGIASADGHSAPRELTARKGLMTLISLNVGVVGDMARGRADYDAAAAQSAADNLAAIGMISQDSLWPEGTSSDDVEGSRALPKIWEDRAGFDAAWDGFVKATAALQANAGGGLEGLQAAMGDLGKSCGTCHDDYRQPR